MTCRLLAQLLSASFLLLAAGCETSQETNLSESSSPSAAEAGAPAASVPAAPHKQNTASLGAWPEAEAEPVLAQRYPGTDRFVRAPRRPLSESRRIDGEFYLNFEDAEIEEVVRVILGDTLDASYVLDPRVQGMVSLQTTAPLSADAVLATLETLLRANGGALVRDGELFRIVPAEEAIKASLVPQLGGGGQPIPPGYAVRIVPLQHISVSQMERLLEPFVSPGGIVRADRDRNILVLAGTSRELRSLLETVEIFDVDWLAGMSVGIFPLTQVASDVVVEELERVFGSGEEGPLEGLVRFVPVERLNAVMVIASRAQYLERAESWVARLDRASTTGQNLYVYYLQHGKAADLANILSEVFSSRNRRAEQEFLGRVAPGRAEARLESVGPATTEPTAAQEAAGGQEGVVATVAAQVPARQSEGIAFSEAADIQIIADEVNNALLVLASPQDYQMVEAALRKLDIVPLQVLIEATIAEVTLNDELRYGVQWFFQSDDFGVAADATGTLSAGSAADLLSTFPGFSLVLTEAGAARLVLDALEGVTSVNVVSSPHLMVLDNQTAELQVGDEVPVVTQQATSIIDVDAPLVNTVQFRDTGVILKVTPRVSANGSINMEIEQEVSDVAQTTTSGIDSPTISQRRVKSSVVVQSGQTVVLGGLIDESRSRSSSGLPVLSTIPVVGSLFGRKERNAERTELIVLISPRVVRNELEAREITKEIRAKMLGLKEFERLGTLDVSGGDVGE